jgi:hypothetical protein
MDYTPEFEIFWKAYPSRWNRELGLSIKRKKYPAFLKWQKLSKAIKGKCLARVHLIKQFEGVPRDCVTWINQRGWDDMEWEEIKKLPMGLPKEMIENLLKKVPEVNVNVSNVRNRLKDKLGVK